MFGQQQVCLLELENLCMHYSDQPHNHVRPPNIEENLKLYTAAQHCAWKCIHCCVAVYNLKIICITLLAH